MRFPLSPSRSPPIMTCPPAPFSLSLQLTLVFGGINVPLYSMPKDWQFMYWGNGLASMLRMWLLPQFNGDTTIISVVVNGVPTPQTVQDFVFLRLGATSAAEGQTVGIMLAIMAAALIISCLAHTFINYTVR